MVVIFVDIANPLHFGNNGYFHHLKRGTRCGMIWIIHSLFNES